LGELNVDLGFKGNVGKKASVLTGVNYFNYSNPIDNNNDNFTDVTLRTHLCFSKMELSIEKTISNYLWQVGFFTKIAGGGEMQWRKIPRR
jgi:outer membrane receptor for ferrienterochelin and colicins